MEGVIRPDDEQLYILAKALDEVWIDEAIEATYY